jgi:predicted small integral membrane protein
MEQHYTLPRKVSYTAIAIFFLFISLSIINMSIQDFRRLSLRWQKGVHLIAQVQCYESAESITAREGLCLMSYTYQGKEYLHYVREFTGGNPKRRIRPQSEILIDPEQPQVFYNPHMEGWTPLVGIIAGWILAFLSLLAIWAIHRPKKKKQILGASFRVPPHYQALQAKVQGIAHRDVPFHDEQYRICLVLGEDRLVYSHWLPYNPSPYLPALLNVYLPPQAPASQQIVLIDGRVLPEALIY